MSGTVERTRRQGSIGAIVGQAARAAAAVSAKLAAAVSRQAINRRVLRQLAVMSDRELKDIGLHRQDVSDAAALPATGDASLLLLARRNERRGARPAPATAC